MVESASTTPATSSVVSTSSSTCESAKLDLPKNTASPQDAGESDVTQPPTTDGAETTTAAVGGESAKIMAVVEPTAKP